MMKAEKISVHRDSKRVLTDIDLMLKPGEMLGVLGPNGAGKSTLLGALCAELKPTQGQIWLDDRPLTHWTGQQRARRLAVLPQSSTLSFAFKVQEVVAMGRLPHDSGQQRDAEIIQAVLETADAVHLQDRNYLALSGGERQRVHLARVLAQIWPGEGGQTLLLDEPTSMLDPLHQHTTLQAVRGFADRGGAVMVILHDLNLAARYCDRLLLLESGCPFAMGTPDEVLVPDALRAVFGLEVLVQRHPERGHPLIIAR
ncbi:MAG: heme ABC transporter ATP-binding protein [Pseudomonas sp.]|uniref:heme ABC transporter ATP-binding protein n=1 Tax=Pseudomonas sp. TaxID=306 RepID=UPI003D6FE8DE